jgi:anti-anti-sigma factor
MSQPQSNRVRVATEQGVLVLTVLDTEMREERTCAAIRQEFLDAVTKSGSKKIVVDFANVSFLSTVAFRPLLSLRRLAHEAKARLVLCNLSELVAEVFHATRLLAPGGSGTAPFEAQPDVASAVAYLNSTS